MSIQTALELLDPANDEHWTADGLPRVDVVAELLGDSNVKRSDITDAAPNFTRESAAKPQEDPDIGNGDSRQAVPSDTSDNPAERDGTQRSEGHERPAEAVAHDAEAQNGEQGPAAPESCPVEQAPEAEPPLTPGQAQVAANGGLEPGQKVRPGRERDLEKLQAELKEAEAEMLEAQAEHRRMKEVADAAANRVNALNRKIEVLQKADPGYSTRGIMDYVRSQNALRLKRAEGMLRLNEMLGVSAAQAAQATDPRSPLDRAMAGRKPARGSQRPVAHRKPG